MDETEIGWAMRQLYRGRCVRRAGWNGKGMHLYWVEGRKAADGTYYEGYIMMVTVKGTHIPWLASQADIAANDYEVVDLEAA